MRNLLLHILCLSAILLPFNSFCQSLPALSKASEINTGTLPNGIRYYLVANSEAPGLADFNLVQKTETDTYTACEALVDLPHFNGRKPMDFLSQNGVGYTSDGFIRHLPGATLYHFDNIPITTQAVADSSLLLLLDLARTSPGEQALVVCGDINVSKLTERMQMLSMMVAPRSRNTKEAPYVWKDQEKPLTEFSRSRIGKVCVSYRSPRTQKALMNTLQPVMTHLFSSELRGVLRLRISQEFEEAGLPLSDYNFVYIGSEETAGDESFVLSISTDPSKTSQAAEILGAILSDLDRNGASAKEFTEIKNTLSATLSRGLGNETTSNAQYSRRCIANYLYDSNLASTSSLNEILTSHKLALETELELFNRFVSAMLDRNRNLTLSFSAPKDLSASRDDFLAAFHKGWDSGRSFTVNTVDIADTTKLAGIGKRKVKIKTEISEPLSGGKMLTFSNGMKVIVKKTSLKGEFRYAMMFKGGYAGVQGLKAGEGEFVGDMLALERISGMSGDEFRRLLNLNGVDMQSKVGISDWRITGSAPSNKTQLVMRALLSVVNSRSVDKDAFALWKQEEILRLRASEGSSTDIYQKIDSVACPESAYPVRKSIASLQDNLPKRAEEYFSQQAANAANGIMVFIGDIDEEAIKKLLCRSLGDFHAGNQRSIRPGSKDTPVPMWLTLGYRNPGTKALTVQMTAVQEFNISKYMIFKLSALAVEQELIKAFADKGEHVKVTAVASSVPSERFTMQIRCTPCPRSSVPADVTPASPYEALEIVRSVLNKMTGSKNASLNDSSLKLYKNLLVNELTAKNKGEDAILNAVLDRNSEGKDLMSEYAKAVNAVKSADIAELLGKLDGCKVEFLQR